MSQRKNTWPIDWANVTVRYPLTSQRDSQWPTDWAKATVSDPLTEPTRQSVTHWRGINDPLTESTQKAMIHWLNAEIRYLVSKSKRKSLQHTFSLARAHSKVFIPFSRKTRNEWDLLGKRAEKDWLEGQEQRWWMVIGYRQIWLVFSLEIQHIMLSFEFVHKKNR
jgi:YD repeat-containing protein